jgi:hypothetical protein
MRGEAVHRGPAAHTVKSSNGAPGHQIPVPAAEFLQVPAHSLRIILASDDVGQRLEKSLRWTSMEAGNMAPISASIAKS